MLLLVVTVPTTTLTTSSVPLLVAYCLGGEESDKGAVKGSTTHGGVPSEAVTQACASEYKLSGSEAVSIVPSACGQREFRGPATRHADQVRPCSLTNPLAPS